MVEIDHLKAALELREGGLEQGMIEARASMQKE
jgi:hypothetical protein